MRTAWMRAGFRAGLRLGRVWARPGSWLASGQVRGRLAPIGGKRGVPQSLRSRGLRASMTERRARGFACQRRRVVRVGFVAAAGRSGRAGSAVIAQGDGYRAGGQEAVFGFVGEDAGSAGAGAAFRGRCWCRCQRQEHPGCQQQPECQPPRTAEAEGRRESRAWMAIRKQARAWRQGSDRRCRSKADHNERDSHYQPFLNEMSVPLNRGRRGSRSRRVRS